MLYDTVLKVMVGRVDKADKDKELKRIATLLPPSIIAQMKHVANIPLLDLWYRLNTLKLAAEKTRDSTAHLFNVLERNGSVGKHAAFMTVLAEFDKVVKTHMQVFKQLDNIYADVHQKVDQLLDMDMCDDRGLA